MLERRPDLLELLFQDYWRSRFGEEGTKKDGEATTRLHTWSRAFALQAKGYQAVY